jgi:hypothetical protein
LRYSGSFAACRRSRRRNPLVQEMFRESIPLLSIGYVNIRQQDAAGYESTVPDPRRLTMATRKRD